MPKYIVLVPELHYSHREVEADSPEEAREMAVDGLGDETFLEYSHTLYPESDTVNPWEVNEKTLDSEPEVE